MTSLFPQHFKSQLYLLVGIPSYRMVLPFIPNCLIACIIRPVGITNSRHVTEGGGLEPIRDIVTVGRAWYLLLDERVALDLPVRRNCYCMCLGGLWALCVVVNNLNSSDVHAQLFGLNPTYLQFFCKGFRHVEKYGMLVSGIDPRRFDLSAHDHV